MSTDADARVGGQTRGTGWCVTWWGAAPPVQVTTPVPIAAVTRRAELIPSLEWVRPEGTAARRRPSAGPALVGRARPLHCDAPSRHSWRQPAVRSPG